MNGRNILYIAVKRVEGALYGGEAGFTVLSVERTGTESSLKMRLKVNGRLHEDGKEVSLLADELLGTPYFRENTAIRIVGLRYVGDELLLARNDAVAIIEADLTAFEVDAKEAEDA